MLNALCLRLDTAFRVRRGARWARLHRSCTPRSRTCKRSALPTSSAGWCRWIASEVPCGTTETATRRAMCSHALSRARITALLSCRKWAAASAGRNVPAVAAGSAALFSPLGSSTGAVTPSATGSRLQTGRGAHSRLQTHGPPVQQRDGRAHAHARLCVQLAPRSKVALHQVDGALPRATARLSAHMRHRNMSHRAECTSRACVMWLPTKLVVGPDCARSYPACKNDCSVTQSW